MFLRNLVQLFWRNNSNLWETLKLWNGTQKEERKWVLSTTGNSYFMMQDAPEEKIHNQCVFFSYRSASTLQMFPAFQSSVHHRDSRDTIPLHTFPAFEHSSLLSQEHRGREVKTCFPMLVLGIDVKVVGYAVLVTDVAMYFFMLVIHGSTNTGPMARELGKRAEIFLSQSAIDNFQWSFFWFTTLGPCWSGNLSAWRVEIWLEYLEFQNFFIQLFKKYLHRAY